MKRTIIVHRKANGTRTWCGRLNKNVNAAWDGKITCESCQRAMDKFTETFRRSKP